MGDELAGVVGADEKYQVAAPQLLSVTYYGAIAGLFLRTVRKINAVRFKTGV